MGFEKYFTSSGCNCPELNTVKIPLKDGKLESKIDLPEEVKDKIVFCVNDNGISIEVLYRFKISYQAKQKASTALS